MFGILVFVIDITLLRPNLLWQINTRSN